MASQPQKSILGASGTDPSFASVPTLSALGSRYDAIAVGYPYRDGKEAVELAKRELAGFTLGCNCPLDQQGAQLLRLSVLHCGVAGRYGSPANDGKGGGWSD